MLRTIRHVDERPLDIHTRHTARPTVCARPVPHHVYVGNDTDTTTEKGRYGWPSKAGRTHMTILLFTIPAMILAIAIATVPVLAAMRREERDRVLALQRAVSPATSYEASERLAA